MVKKSNIAAAELAEEQNHVINLRNEISFFKQNREEEIRIRQQFEKNINELNALQRDIDIKYKRACEDIYTLQEVDKENKKKFMQMESQIKKLEIENEEYR